MSVLSDSSQLRRLLESLIKPIVRSETRDCFRVYKATVVTEPFSDERLGSACQVKLIGDQTPLTLPYSTKMQNMAVGDVVLVAVIYGSWRNAIVWETTGLNAGNS